MPDSPQASTDGATPQVDALPVMGTPSASSATLGAMNSEQMQAEIARLTDTLAATRKESIQHRTKLSAYEKAQAEADAAKLDETQKAAKRADDAEAKVKEYETKLLHATVKDAARALGFVNPDLAAKLITVNPDATPDDISAALASLLKDNPYLAAQAPSGSVRPAAQPSMNGARSAQTQPQQTLADAYKNRQGLGVIWEKS